MLESISSEHTIFWFRRDLRLRDNIGLFHALSERGNVIPLFIFDSNILDELPQDDRRISFIHGALKELSNKLVELNTSLLTWYGDPVELFRQISPGAVYANHDYEPYAIERDELIAAELKDRGIALNTYKDQVIFERDEITKDDGNPYVVFTPYSKKWRQHFNEQQLPVCDITSHQHRFCQFEKREITSLDEMGFKKSFNYHPPVVSRQLIHDYHKTRDIPSINGTSRLSPHLRFGTVSIREMVSTGIRLNATWLNELIWREFYMMILWHFPHVVGGSFRPVYDKIPWRNNEKEFDAWCSGTTGYPIVDAGMRELNETGFMHNRVRMITASFLTKHLLIDWRWGEAYFAKQLLDFELSSNNGGWQWAAGSGCDAAPYFRVFNPEAQMKKFDPNLEYVKRWVPEYGTDAYPTPIVDHKFARQRALDTYSSVLKKS